MPKPSISITYCPKCKWLMRSAWMAQELLSTFEEELLQVSLCPSEEPGKFEIMFDDTSLWERKRDGGFPDVKQLKQRVRDQIDPNRDLGHIDK